MFVTRNPDRERQKSVIRDDEPTRDKREDKAIGDLSCVNSGEERYETLFKGGDPRKLQQVEEEAIGEVGP